MAFPFACLMVSGIVRVVTAIRELCNQIIFWQNRPRGRRGRGPGQYAFLAFWGGLVERQSLIVLYCDREHFCSLIVDLHLKCSCTSTNIAFSVFAHFLSLTQVDKWERNPNDNLTSWLVYLAALAMSLDHSRLLKLDHSQSLFYFAPRLIKRPNIIWRQKRFFAAKTSNLYWQWNVTGVKMKASGVFFPFSVGGIVQRRNLTKSKVLYNAL